MKREAGLTKVLPVIIAVITMICVIYSASITAHAVSGPSTSSKNPGAILVGFTHFGDWEVMYLGTDKNKTATFEGFKYTKSNNTLTIKNTGTDEDFYLEVYDMGDDFKIKVEGKNSLGYIAAYSNVKDRMNLTITGTGTLTVNKGGGYGAAIKGYANGKSNTKITIDNTVNLNLYGGENIFENTKEKVIVVEGAKSSKKSDVFRIGGKKTGKTTVSKKKGKKGYNYTYGAYKLIIKKSGKSFLNESSSSSSSAKKKTTTYTVKYNLNGGEGKISNQTKTKGKNLKLSTKKPTKDGYIFKGWSTQKNGKVKYNPGDTYKEDSNVTLYAKWKEKNIFKPEDTILSLSKGKKSISGTISGEYKDNAKYTSSDTSVVTVSNGVLTPKSEGVAYVTIKTRKDKDKKWKTRKIAVTVNSSNLYKKINLRDLPGMTFKSASAARNLDKIYCPQGVCVTKKYILVSAYNTGGKESRIYAYDKSSYKYVACFSTETKAHVGGITYDKDNGIIFVANDKNIQYFTENELERYLKNDEVVQVKNIKPASGVTKPAYMQTSTLTWHKGRLWIAVYNEDTTYDIRDITYTVSKTNDADGNPTVRVEAIKYSDSKMHGAKKINGIAFDPNDDNTMYLTSSTGRKDFSGLYRCRADLDKACGTVKKIKTIPSMAEGIAFLDNNMLILYESCSDRYQDEKLTKKADNKNPVKHPMNYFTVFSLSNL